jgi:hypothetical protein
VCRSKHGEPSINYGIINSITILHLVGISTEALSEIEFITIIETPTCFGTGGAIFREL